MGRSILLLFAFTGLHTWANCSEEVDRTYDFTERVVLINEPETFRFEHCKQRKCHRITSHLKRDISRSDFMTATGKQAIDDLQSLNKYAVQAISDALSNYSTEPNRYRLVAFGYSVSPIKEDVWCSSLPIAEFLQEQDKAKSSDFRFKYKGKCNQYCMASGDENTVKTSMKDFTKGIRNLERMYNEARAKILKEN